MRVDLSAHHDIRVKVCGLGRTFSDQSMDARRLVEGRAKQGFHRVNSATRQNRRIAAVMQDELSRLFYVDEEGQIWPPG